jgi:hypothetical protein
MDPAHHAVQCAINPLVHEWLMLSGVLADFLRSRDDAAT